MKKLLQRVNIRSGVCGGQPCIRGTRISLSVILDALAEGLSPKEIVDHYPSLSEIDIRAAIAYASELTRENVWKVTA